MLMETLKRKPLPVISEDIREKISHSLITLTPFEDKNRITHCFLQKHCQSIYGVLTITSLQPLRDA